MIVYLSFTEPTPKKDVIAIENELQNAGHDVIHPLFPSDALMAISDAIVFCPQYPAYDADYAKRLNIPTYTYPEIPDMHPTEVRNPNQAQAFREIQGQMYRTHLKKNADYSPANILGTGEIGLVTRMWDKMARLLNLSGFNLEIKSSTFNVPKQPKNESIEDTIMDLAVYSVISMLYRAGKWGN